MRVCPLRDLPACKDVRGLIWQVMPVSARYAWLLACTGGTFDSRLYYLMLRDNITAYVWTYYLCYRPCAAEAAAWHNRVDVLKEFIARGAALRAKTLMIACGQGNVESVECLLDVKLSIRDEWFRIKSQSHDIAYHAGMGGLRVCKVMRVFLVAWQHDIAHDIAHGAAVRGHVDVLHWLSQYMSMQEIAAIAVMSASVATMESLEVDQLTFYFAIKRGDYAMMEYIHKRVKPHPCRNASAEACNGGVEMLEWMVARHVYATPVAAHLLNGGNLVPIDVSRWLIAHNAPLTPSLWHWAIRENNLDTICLLKEHGIERPIELLRELRHVHTREIMHECIYGFPLRDVWVHVASAVTRSNTSWLFENLPLYKEAVRLCRKAPPKLLSILQKRAGTSINMNKRSK